MPRYMVLTLIFLMTTNNSKLDLILKHFTNELKDWRKDTPKTWYAYIRMHLHMYYKKRMKNDKDMHNVLSDILCNSKSLLLNSKKVILTWDVTSGCDRNAWSYCGFRRCVMKYPIGQFFFYNIDGLIGIVIIIMVILIIKTLPQSLFILVPESQIEDESDIPWYLFIKWSIELWFGMCNNNQFTCASKFIKVHQRP